MFETRSRVRMAELPFTSGATVRGAGLGLVLDPYAFVR